MTLDGTWAILYQGPTGEKEADLVLSTDGTTMTGTFDGTPIDEGEVNGTEFSYTAKLTSPAKIKVKCTGTYDGDTMSGKVKAAFVAISFSGKRKAV
jgi:hypothetical protein